MAGRAFSLPGSHSGKNPPRGQHDTRWTRLAVDRLLPNPAAVPLVQLSTVNEPQPLATQSSSRCLDILRLPMQALPWENENLCVDQEM
jgi:hypothetical protein